MITSKILIRNHREQASTRRHYVKKIVHSAVNIASNRRVYKNYFFHYFYFYIFLTLRCAASQQFYMLVGNELNLAYTAGWLRL
jgi:hypothetical protein